MKTISTILMAAVLIAGNHLVLAQPAAAPPPSPEKPPTADAKPVEAAVIAPAVTEPMAAPAANSSGTNGIRLNFVNAPLESVLKYLSDAANFHIILESPARGNVTVISSHPLTKDDAVILLNSVLNKSGLAAIRNEQFLTIVTKEEAVTRDIPVNVYNDDPQSIPKNAEIVTQIIPIRFVEARQLVSDLSLFVSQQARIVANEAGNSIVITDTQANIRHLAEIIKAIDSSAEASTEIQVFHLQHANPTDVANVLAGIFPSQNSAGGAQTPIRFGGGRGGFGGGFGGGGRGGFGGGGNPFAAFLGGQTGNTGNNTQDRIRKQQQVVAVADMRTSSVVVTAQKDLMDQIGEMIKQLDVASERDTKVTVIPIKNGDPQQILQVLQSTFGINGSSGRSGTTSSSQTSALEQRAQQNAQQMGNQSSGSSSSILGNNRGNTAGRGGISF